ncbi:RimK/LysX family protein [Tropicimonas sp. IMCC34011]|uniref:ATP-dependent zinc protease family protein n=1 Tax=Tropicimonas sp. IMCC34011 TaxID=2248759 RepID=UPI000E27B5FA|nr:RimK/LysX family protein [Tropicimonas sp. IMCC34011]
MPTRPTTPTVIGWRERAGLPDLGIPELIAKIDTGARTSAIHATRIVPFERDGEAWVRFHVPHAGLPRAFDCEAVLLDRREITNTSGSPELRHVISTGLVIAGRRWKIELSLAHRGGMRHPIILGRTAIRKRNILVDAGRSFMTRPRPTHKAKSPSDAKDAI